MKAFLSLLICLALAVTAALQAEAAPSKKGKASTGKSSAASGKKKAATPKPKSKASPSPRPKGTPAASPSPAAASSGVGEGAPAAATTTPKPATPKPEKPAIEGQPAPPLPKRDPSAAVNPTPAAGTPRPQFAPPAIVSTSDILGFEDQPPRVRRLIESALELTRRNLTYTYGSADPAKGGMDCSGTIYFLLREHGIPDVPRDAAGQYAWTRKEGQFFAVVSKKQGGFEFADLLPGDLLFWSGTYDIERDPPVTHTMVYLGIQRGRGQHIMWGASDGRTYDGKPRYGVSVFDFKMPRAESGSAPRSDFLGYGRIPGLRD